MVSQQAMRFHNRIGYHPYEGITEDFGERARILQALSNNRALILNNHGLLTVGKNAREAFVLMKYLMSAAEIQLRMEATGSRADRDPARDLREGRGAIPVARLRPRRRRLAGLSAHARPDRPELPELKRTCRRSCAGLTRASIVLRRRIGLPGQAHGNDARRAWRRRRFPALARRRYSLATRSDAPAPAGPKTRRETPWNSLPIAAGASPSKSSTPRGFWRTPRSRRSSASSTTS